MLTEQTDLPLLASLVAEEDRMDFLPAYFGRRLMMRGEAQVYAWMDKLCDDYHGGYWHFYTLSNGGFYMAPNRNEPMRLRVVGNYFDGEMSADAAGIVATTFALTDVAIMARDDEAEALMDRYCLLRHFAAEHQESSAILQAID